MSVSQFPTVRDAERSRKKKEEEMLIDRRGPKPLIEQSKLVKSRPCLVICICFINSSEKVSTSVLKTEVSVMWVETI